MKIFSRLYSRTMRWAQHPHATYYLTGLSFIEASCFPIPPDVMLAPMSLSKPQRAWWYASICTLASVLGGIFGYLLGVFFWAAIKPWFVKLGYYDQYLIAQQYFIAWGFLAMVVAGFTPVPYKIFTITAGAMSMAFLPFVVASIIGRSARFYLVAGLMRWGGEKMEQKLRQYVDWVGWGTLLLILIGIWIWH